MLFCCESSAEQDVRETFLILFALDSFSDGQKICQRNDSFRPGAESMVFAWCLQVYILSLRGDTIITRDFRGDVVKGTAEDLSFESVMVIQDDKNTGARSSEESDFWIEKLFVGRAMT